MTLDPEPDSGSTPGSSGIDPEQLPPDELRALRDRLLESVPEHTEDDPELPALWAAAGQWSYLLYEAQEQEEDLRLAEACLTRAFAGPGDDEEWRALLIVRAHVRLLAHGHAPPADELPVLEQWLTTGLAALGTGPEDRLPRAVARHLLAGVAHARFEEEDTGPLLDSAIERHREALAEYDQDDPETADLGRVLAELYCLRAEATGNAAEADTAARLFCDAVRRQESGQDGADGADGAADAADLAYLRACTGHARYLHGRLTGRQESWRRAAEAFEQALTALEGQEEEPEWGFEVHELAAFTRTMLWWHWDEADQEEPAADRAQRLLDRPGAIERVSPEQLCAFGRLRYLRARGNQDREGQDEGIAWVRRAVDRWDPDRHGPEDEPVLMLAQLHLDRSRSDRSPGRMVAIARCANRLLTEDASPAVRLWALLLRGQVRQQLTEDGTAAGLAGDRMKVRRAVADALGADRPAAGRAAERTGSPANGEAPDTGTVAAPDGDAYLRLVHRLTGVGGPEEQAPALFALWRRLPADGDQRAALATHLVRNLSRLDRGGPPLPQEQVEELIQAAESRTYSAEDQRLLDTQIGAALLSRGRDGSPALDRGEAYLARAARADGLADVAGRKGLHLMALGARGQFGGGLDDQERFVEELAQQADQSSDPYLALLAGAQAAALRGQRAGHRGDLAEMDRAVATLAAAEATLGKDDGSRLELLTFVEQLRMERWELARRLGTAPVSVGEPIPVAELRRLAAVHDAAQRALLLGQHGIMRLAHAARTRSATRCAEAADLLRESLELLAPDSVMWPAHAGMLGRALLAGTAFERDPRKRNRCQAEAITWMERALERAGGPGHRNWAEICLNLSEAYRQRGDERHGDRAASRRYACDGLRGYAYAALLQSGTAHAAEIGRPATWAALWTAGICLSDGCPDEAVEALESCRGLVLHAAVTAATVPEQLAAAGRADLAQQWAEAAAEPPPGPMAELSGHGVPSELRRRVLDQLTAEGVVRARLLDPPAPAEIAGALRSMAQDALVYLMPGDQRGDGAAVVVTARGETHAVPLPRLRADAPPLTAYRPYVTAARVAGPDTDEMPQADGSVPHRQLDRLCDWAWYAVMGPLLDAFTPDGVSADGPVRPPALVLVPLGALDTVPWHAAWRDVAGGGRRYAFADAEISYAASARLLCEVAARPAPERPGGALLVGDPTGDLRHAGEEARGVHRAHYPDGGYLGRGGDRATPRAVLSWMRSDAAAGGTLHLACHATVARNERRSALLALDGGQLSAEELTEGPGPARRLDLVVLAACRSHVSGRGQNQAYTLATAFLVAGARSVIGSLWPVPDDATSLLMFMTHHFRLTAGLPPGRALRRAQFWMLDPGRTPPPGMPPELARRAADLDPADLTSWAGFTHLGH